MKLNNSSSDYLTYKKSKMNPARVQRVEKRVEKIRRILKLSFITFCVMFICVVIFIKKYAKRVDIEYGRHGAEISKENGKQNLNDNYFNDLKPGIAPDLLLLRPFGQKEFDQVNTELFDAFLERMNSPNPDDHFVLNSREGRTLISYGRIMFFEASNKKINLRTDHQEYDFYDSIENLQTVVPDWFIRCHRSYLVNTRKIRKVKMSEGLIEMEGGAVVPLSRTYKQDLKRLIK